MIKSKETSSQLKPVRKSYVIVMHQSIMVSSTACSLVHVQIKHPLAHLHDLIPTYFGLYKKRI